MRLWVRAKSDGEVRDNRSEAGAAPTDIRPLDREPLTEGGPVPIVPPRALSRIDGCPECVINAETPSSVWPTHDGYLANYVCLDCGHAWSTSWKD